jgi:hypothetical protein
MANQPRYDPYEPATSSPTACPRVRASPAPVARGESRERFFLTGNGGQVRTVSLPDHGEVIDRGHERFNIYCSPCHGRLGDGNGMIPSRGYRRPPSFHTETLRQQPDRTLSST